MNFDRLRQLLIQKAIEGKLVPQLDTELPVQQIGSSPSNIPFAIPKKWKWERLDSVFTLQAGKFIAASEISSEGPYLCYGGNGIRGRVSLFNREGRFPLIGRQGARQYQYCGWQVLRDRTCCRRRQSWHHGCRLCILFPSISKFKSICHTNSTTWPISKKNQCCRHSRSSVEGATPHRHSSERTPFRHQTSGRRLYRPSESG